MTASVGMAQAAAGALAFVITDAAMPQWEWRGVDISATLLNISGVCVLLSSFSRLRLLRAAASFAPKRRA